MRTTVNYGNEGHEDDSGSARTLFGTTTWNQFDRYLLCEWLVDAARCLQRRIWAVSSRVLTIEKVLSLNGPLSLERNGGNYDKG